MIVRSFIRWVVMRPWQAIGVSLLFVFILGWGLQDYRTTNNPRSFFGPNNPDYELLKNIERQYGNREMVVFIVHPLNDNIFTRENLSLLHEMTEKSWQMPTGLRVFSLTNFHYTTVDGDTLTTQPLVKYPERLSDEEISRIRDIALNEPSLLFSAISPKGHVAGIAVSVTMDEERSQAPVVAAWAKALRDGIASQHPDVEIMLTGSVMFSDAMMSATRSGVTDILPLGLLAATIMLSLFLRNVLAVAFSLLVLVLSVLSSVGAAAWLGILFQPITSFAPVIILTLSVAESMHILTSYHQHLRRGLHKTQAMIGALHANFQSILLTSVMTIIGFISLNPSDSPPLRDMGNVVAIGVTVALWLSLALLPALCMVTPAPQVRPEEGLAQRYVMRLAEFVIKHHRVLFICSSLSMLVLGSLITKNELNDVWNEYFDSSFEVRRANDFVARELSGLHRVELSIPARDQGGVVDPEYLQKLDELRAWANAQPEVVFTITFADVIKRLNREMHAGDNAFYKVPESREFASQYLLLFEMSLPFGLGLDNAVTIGKDATLFDIVLKPASSNDILAFKQRVDDWIGKNFPAYMRTPATGLDSMFATVTQRNIHSMMGGMIFEIVLIILTLSLVHRSLKYGIYSVLPNLAPCAMAFGVWAVFHGRLGLTDTIVACITMGIVVDDTIHFLGKYAHARRDLHLMPKEAVRYVFANIGVSIIGTTLVLVVCFAALTTSHFYPMRSFGLLTCLTMLLAMTMDLLFFTSFLILFDRKSSKAVGEESPNLSNVAKEPVV